MKLQLWMTGTVAPPDGLQAGFIAALLSEQVLIHINGVDQSVWVKHDAFTPDGGFVDLRAGDD